MKMGCTYCRTLHTQVKNFDFPARTSLFKRVDLNTQVTTRVAALEDFVVALIQYLGRDGLIIHCKNVLNVQNMVRVSIVGLYIHNMNNIYLDITHPRCKHFTR
jgi:hypothetical protein